MKGGIFAVLCSLAVFATDIKYVKEGASVELKCPESPVEYWQNVKTKHILAICNADGNSVNENLSKKLFVTANCTLGIHNVSSEDITQYHCVTSTDEYKINLQLSVPPSNLTMDESNEHYEIYGAIGQETTIKCRVNSGVPNETIRLTKDGKTLISGGPSVLLYKFTAEFSDDMTKIVCYANNTIDDPITQEVTFRILKKPIVLAHASPNYTISEGQSVTLTCKVESYGNFEKLYWTYNGNQDESNPLVISSVLPSHAGEYTCIAINKAGKGESKVILYVMYSPRLQDKNVTFDGHSKKREIVCNPIGIPDTYVFEKWTHISFLGQHLRYLNGSRNGTLSLPYDGYEDPRYHDSGIYTCNVSNNIPDNNGTLWRIGRVNVKIKGKPALARPRYASVQFGVFNATSDISIGLLSSTRVSDATWFDEGKEILQMENLCIAAEISSTFCKTEYNVFGYICSLTIKNTQRESFQNYTVTVYNEVGSNTFVIALRSASRPMTPEIISLQSGANYIAISWRPAFDGGYSQSFVFEYRKRSDNLWINSTVNADGDDFKISYLYDLEADSEYEIRMFAFNKVGRSDDTTAHLMKTKGNAIENELYNSADELTTSNTDTYSIIDRRIMDESRLIEGVSQTEQSDASNGQRKGHFTKNERKNRPNFDLNYVQVLFEPIPADRKFYIHGTENRTPYADIDFSAKVDLSSLPTEESSSSDQECDEDDFMCIENIKQYPTFS